MTEPSEQLQVVWAKIPDAHCQGLCASSCGPVDCSLEERRLLRERGIKLRSHVSVMLDLAAGIEPDMCPALVDGRCSVYEVRPTVCRLWGAGPAMPCPWGCEPDVPLTIRESAEILGESFGLTIPKGYPLPVIATQIEPAP